MHSLKLPLSALTSNAKAVVKEDLFKAERASRQRVEVTVHRRKVFMNYLCCLSGVSSKMKYIQVIFDCSRG